MATSRRSDGADELGELRQSVQQLSMLLDLSRVLSSELNLDRLLHMIMARATEMLEADRSTLFLVDERSQQLWSRVAQGDGINEIRIPLSTGIAGYVATTGATVNITDAYADPRFNQSVDLETGYHTRTILCMPVREGTGRVMGVLQVLNKRGGVFTVDDERLLSAFGVQAAVALTNAALMEARKREVEKSSTLLGLMRSVSARLELDDLLDQIMAHTRSIMHAERANLYLADYEEQFLIAKITQDTQFRDRIPFGVGLPGYVVATGVTLNIPDAHEDFRFDDTDDRLTGFVTRSVLCMPLRDSSGRILGVLEVINKDSGLFTQDDEELLDAIGAQEVIALENANLFADIWQMKQYNDSVLHTMATGVITLDMLGRISTVNTAAQRILGFPDGIPPYTRFKSAIRGEENAAVWQKVVRAYTQGLPSPVDEVKFLQPNGNHVTLNIWTEPLRDQHSQIGVVLVMEDITRERQLAGTLRRVVSHQVAEQLMASGELPEVGGTRRRVTVLMSDIRDFTPMTEAHEPEEIVSMLNEYFGKMIDIVFRWEGTLDKFVGDAIMAVFGTPMAHDDDPIRAVCTAIEMRQQLKLFNEKRIEEGKPPIQIGIGICEGEAISGAIGSQERLEFTVIGDTVNTAARLEGLTKRFPDHKILMNEPVYERVKHLLECEFLDDELVKGKAQPVRVYGISEAVVHAEHPLPEALRAD